MTSDRKLSSQPFVIRPLTGDDHDWVARLLTRRWGSPQVVSRGRLHQADRLPGFCAVQAGTPRGLITYHITGGECEIVTLDSVQEGEGIGTALIEAVEAAARQARCRRLWLITTNDNLNALRFYQKRGFVLAALHRDALTASRRLKPQIPLVGQHGIPLRDELELELLLEEVS